jgi:hypothetical protein
VWTRIISVHRKFIFGRGKQCVCCKVGTELFRIRQSNASKASRPKIFCHGTANFMKIFLSSSSKFGSTLNRQKQNRKKHKQNETKSKLLSTHIWQMQIFARCFSPVVSCHIQWTATVQWMKHLKLKVKLNEYIGVPATGFIS